MTSFSGKYLWIWEVDQVQGGTVEAIASLGRRLGLTGFIVKAHDGVHPWPQFGHVCHALQALGFAVVAWGYLDGEDPVLEAQAAQLGIAEGADAYVIDAEEGYEGKPDAARIFGQTMRLHHPSLTIGYAPFAFPDLHPTFPYSEFSSVCDVCLPQIYWGEIGLPVASAVHQAYAQLKAFHLPLVPIGQAYGSVTPAQIEQFAATAKSLGATAISFWDAQSANSRQLQAIRAIPPCGSKAVARAPASAITHAPGDRLVLPSDVLRSDWFYPSVQHLLGLDVITGYQDGLFKPHEPITRAQAADWLNRLYWHMDTGGKRTPQEQ